MKKVSWKEKEAGYGADNLVDTSKIETKPNLVQQELSLDLDSLLDFNFSTIKEHLFSPIR